MGYEQHGPLKGSVRISPLVALTLLFILNNYGTSPSVVSPQTDHSPPGGIIGVQTDLVDYLSDHVMARVGDTPMFYEREMPQAGFALEIDSGHWSKPEADMFQRIVEKNVFLATNTFGEREKYIKTLRIVWFSDQLKKEWDWQHGNEATTCNSSTGLCTIYLRGVLSERQGVNDPTRVLLAHGLTHALIGGYGGTGNGGLIGGEGFIFRPMTTATGEITNRAYPTSLFDEENLANFFASYAEKTLWSVKPNNKIGDDVYMTIMAIDPSFFSKVRDFLLKHKLENESSMGFKDIAYLVRTINPKVANYLRW